MVNYYAFAPLIDNHGKKVLDAIQTDQFNLRNIFLEIRDNWDWVRVPILVR
jgi:hypothetical protein